MSNKLENDKFLAIIESVSYWLGYQFKIGRHKLVHEASLRYPIADTITSKEISINRIVLEKLHPLFMSKKIDLVIYDNDVNNINDELDDNDLKEAYEFKIAKNETRKIKSAEHQGVFDDVVRLAYYHKWRRKDCYFLMCGKYEDFKAYFIGQKNEVINKNGKNIIRDRKSNIQKDSSIIEWKPGGLYKDWFGFKIGETKEKEFSIHDSSYNDGWGLQSFKNNYKIRSNVFEFFEDSIKIKTTCLAITSPGLEKTRTHAAGIWKIE